MQVLLGIFLLFHIISISIGYNYDDKEGAYLRSLDSGWAHHTGRDLQERQCVPIPKGMTLCRNVGYENMSLPNLLGHDTVDEVRRQASPWNLLYKIRCHPNTDLFLCSLYAPVCLDRHIFPCRSLCEAVKGRCEVRMIKYGYTWPEILKCDKFPLDDDLCIKQINVSNDEGNGRPGGDEQNDVNGIRLQAANVCIPCKQPLTYESLLDSYCWATFVVKVKVRKAVDDENGDKRIVLKGKKKFYKTIPASDAKTFEPVINGGSECDCEAATAKKKRMLIMGTKQGDRYVVTYISAMSKEKEFKRAMKAIAKKHDCKEEIGKIAGQTEGNNGGLSTSGEPLPPIDEQVENLGGETSKKKDKKKKKKKKKDKNKNKTKDKDKAEDKERPVGIGCLPCQEPTTYDNIMTRFCEADFVAKARKVSQVKIDENGDKRLVLSKTKKGSFYRQQNLSKRDIRKFQPVISGGSNCDCPIAAQGSRNLLVMGRKQGGRFVLTFLSEWGRDSEFKKASRALRKGHDCSAQNNSPSSG